MQKDLITAVIIFLVIVLAGLGLTYMNIAGQSSSSVTPTPQTVSPQTASPSEEQLKKQLQITDVKNGNGTEAKNGNTVTVSYIGTLQNGKIFDQSKPNQPFSFTIGQGQVIKGWDLGIPGMKVGGERKLVIPPALGYGNQSVGSIPPNSTLIFDVKLLSVK